MKVEHFPHEMPAFSLQVNIFLLFNMKQNNSKTTTKSQQDGIIKMSGNKC